MTLMLAHKLRIAEVDITRALEGDTAHELDFRAGRNSSVPLSHSVM